MFATWILTSPINLCNGLTGLVLKTCDSLIQTLSIRWGEQIYFLSFQFTTIWTIWTKTENLSVFKIFPEDNGKYLSVFFLFFPPSGASCWSLLCRVPAAEGRSHLPAGAVFCLARFQKNYHMELTVSPLDVSGREHGEFHQRRDQSTKQLPDLQVSAERWRGNLVLRVRL